MGKKSLIILSKVLGVIAILIAIKIAFYSKGKPVYEPKFGETVYALIIIGISLFYIDNLSKTIKQYRVSKIKFSPIELELNSVENILGVGDDVNDPRQKKGLLALVDKAFKDIDGRLAIMVDKINDPELAALKTSVGVLSEKKMALIYLKYDDVRPELVSAFLQLRVKRLDLLVKEKNLENSQIIKIIGLCYQILADLDSIDNPSQTTVESIG